MIKSRLYDLAVFIMLSKQFSKIDLLNCLPIFNSEFLNKWMASFAHLKENPNYCKLKLIFRECVRYQLVNKMKLDIVLIPIDQVLGTRMKMKVVYKVFVGPLSILIYKGHPSHVLARQLERIFSFLESYLSERRVVQ